MHFTQHRFLSLLTQCLICDDFVVFMIVSIIVIIILVIK